ncbi:hypothetical protein ACI6PS_03560 [Flavobacterium sp. PLA-1-15]|uniref:hypothetical protein n=1 Tax=Flavobacterium sp. PLA-1-15 TaxID=3380533 RepID=UPI003B7DC402
MSQRVLTNAEALTYLASIKAGTSLPSVQSRVIKAKTLYIAGASTGLAANNGQLVIPSLVPEVGVTNLPKGNTLPKGTNLLVFGVRVLFETGAGKTTKDADFKSEAPANWKNGELKISQNGTGVLFETSGTDVTNFRASTGNDDDFREVVPFLIRSESPYSIEAQLASAGAANQLYKVELRAIEFVETDKA